MMNDMPIEAKVIILAAVEEAVLQQKFAIVLGSGANKYLLSAQFSYVSEYNMMMGFGGVRYIQVEYADTEWDAIVESYNNDLSTLYK